MDFVVYDITFLILFALFLVLFLYNRRKHLARQGLLYLYRTKVGLRIIDYTADKYKKILKPLQYLVIASGFALMLAMIYLLIRFTFVYLSSPLAAQTLKVPVLTPLIPYLPSLFKIDFLPPFYFTYWIIIIAIIAIPHEFAHGIFAKLNKIKVHSTGFGFILLIASPFIWMYNQLNRKLKINKILSITLSLLITTIILVFLCLKFSLFILILICPFLAAFVEPDEKQMEKLKKIPQMAILASGTFANVLTTIVFALLLWIFFITAFIPVGVNLMNVYPISAVNVSDLTEANGMPLALYNLDNSNLTEVKYQNKTYFIDTEVLRLTFLRNLTQTFIYDNSPAFNSRIAGEPSLLNFSAGPAVIEINGIKTSSVTKLNSTLRSFKPGDTINITTILDDKEETKSITLGNNNGTAYLGIATVPSQPQGKGILSLFYALLFKVKSPSILYESRIGDLGMFIYNLLWWIVIVCFGVALTNMIPVGIFDGGRFFLLAVQGITGSKRAGEIAFKASTWIILLIVAALMAQWFVAVF
jgi:membrane-associated protease RseP (regulator of RpoE activity)